MIQALENLAVADGDPVRTEHIATALTAARFAYDDGATQTFEPGGGTTYVEHERRSHGEWYVDSEGRFCSFWPPRDRACYDLHWIVENDTVVGLRFTERPADQYLLAVTGANVQWIRLSTILCNRSLSVVWPRLAEETVGRSETSFI